LSTEAGEVTMAQTAIDIVEQQQWLDPVGDRLSTAVHSAYDAAGDTGRRLKNAAHGTWLGHPLHPVLTDIPVGAWMTSAVLDAAESATGDRGYGRSADLAIAFGLSGAAVAAATGLTDWSETYGGPRRTGLVHGLLNVAATTLYATSWLMRRNGSRRAAQQFSLAGLAVATTAAYLGGSLVYRDRLGVTHADDQEIPDFTTVLKSDELAEGEKKKVEAGGAPVMLARHHGRVCALAEHCSHLGGPLSEGTLTDNGIICPWHGSEFALEDGRVLNGPATIDQPRFEVREEDGVIAIRR
jgi:nitrite reductase/ring-hydroxylating ferredoxin subunit